MVKAICMNSALAAFHNKFINDFITYHHVVVELTLL